MPALHTMPLQVELVCRSYVDHSALRRGVELGSSMRFDASGAQLNPAAPRKISLLAQRTERSSRRSHPSRQVENRSREHVSAVAVAAAVHLGRVRFPCASSATLGNSTWNACAAAAWRSNDDVAIVARAAFRVA